MHIYCALILINNRVAVSKLAISNEISSIIPRLNVAVNPMKDQINGIINNKAGHFLSSSMIIPNVNIVVGQGNPNVGEYGYTWPDKYPNIG
jgi:hypothetical protein